MSGRTNGLGSFSIFIKDGTVTNFSRWWCLDPKNSSPHLSKSEKKIKVLSDLSKAHFLGVHVPNDLLWQAKDIALESLRKHNGELQVTAFLFLFLADLLWKALAMKILEKLIITHNQEYKKKEKEPVSIPLLVSTLPNNIEANSNLYLLQKVLKTPFQVTYCSCFINSNRLILCLHPIRALHWKKMIHRNQVEFLKKF